MWRTAPDGGVEVVLVHRPRYDDWSLPKGKAHRRESDEDTALREVLEETGLQCRLGRELVTVRYETPRGERKTVRWWEMTVDEDRGFVPDQKRMREALGVDPGIEASLFYEQYDTEPVINIKDPALMEPLRERMKVALAKYDIQPKPKAE